MIFIFFVIKPTNGDLTRVYTINHSGRRLQKSNVKIGEKKKTFEKQLNKRRQFIVE